MSEHKDRRRVRPELVFQVDLSVLQRKAGKTLLFIASVADSVTVRPCRCDNCSVSRGIDGVMACARSATFAAFRMYDAVLQAASELEVGDNFYWTGVTPEASFRPEEMRAAAWWQAWKVAWAEHGPHRTPKGSHQGILRAKPDWLSSVLENRTSASGHMASMIRPRRFFRHG